MYGRRKLYGGGFGETIYVPFCGILDYVWFFRRRVSTERGFGRRHFFSYLKKQGVAFHSRDQHSV